MASNTFQPQVADINSAVTPTEGVADTAGVELFTDVAQAATSAGFAFTGEQELSDLNDKFEKIAKARVTGGVNSTKLQVQARSLLSEAKANSPWIKKKADDLFKTKFGGGGTGSGGIFAATPEEKAEQQFIEDSKEKQLQLGLPSIEDGAKVMQMEARAEQTKKLAESQKQQRQVNGDSFFANTQSQLNINSVKVSSAIQRGVQLGGGSINSDGIRSINLAVDQMELQLKQELNSQVKDSETGQLLIDRASYDSNLEEIEDWVVNTKAQVKDQSYTKILDDTNLELGAEMLHTVNTQYRAVKELHLAAGTEGVKAFFQAVQAGDGPIRQLLIQMNPEIKGMFKEPGSVHEAAITGFNKVLFPNPFNRENSNIPFKEGMLTQQESLALGSVLNDPVSAPMLPAFLGKVATESQGGKAYNNMIFFNPDSTKMAWGEKFKSWAIANPRDGVTFLDKTLDGLKKAYQSAYIAETGSAPKSFEIKSGRAQEVVRTGKGSTASRVKRGKPGAPRPVVDGEGITDTTSKMLFNTYNVFRNNPSYLKEFGGRFGNPDMTAEAATQLSILGEEKPETFTRDDLAFMLTSGQVTQDDIDFLAAQGQVIETGAPQGQSQTPSPSNGPDALALPEQVEVEAARASQEEIAKFQKALRKAKTAEEKSEVFAAFEDGAFKLAQ